ncbi:MAG: hypothetical protein KIS83_07540 [Rubrivivax sp.]|nr:hypothetical protein [Rubrivivax sp.]
MRRPRSTTWSRARPWRDGCETIPIPHPHHHNGDDRDDLEPAHPPPFQRAAGRHRRGRRLRPRRRAGRREDRALRAAQCHRLGCGRDHARRAAGAGQGAGPFGGGREPARRRRHRRPADAGAFGARRHDAVGGVEQRSHLPQRAEVDALRHAGRLHADRHRRQHAHRAGRQPQGAGHQQRRVRRAAEEQAGRAELRLGWQRHHPAPGQRDVPRRGRRQGAPHPVQGRGPDGHRPDRRPGRLRHRRAAQRAGPPEERRAARHRHGHRAALGGGARDPDLRRAGPARLRDGGLVCGHRPQGPARGRRQAHPRRGDRRLQRPGGARGDGPAGQYDRDHDARAGQRGLPQRTRQVRAAGQEGGAGTDVTGARPLRITGRVLFLSSDPAQVRAQLAGSALTRAQAAPLRDDVSTDEITPLPAMVHFDDALGRHAHTGFTAGGERPIAVDALRRAGVQVLVAGRRYGKGSSREHSVVAELAAGVRLVVAEGFERIYRQNADNLGLFTSTDFGLLERIERGEAIGLDELLAGRDALAAAILRAGGLLPFGRARLRQARPAPPDPEDAARPRTLFEKIVERHVLQAPGLPAPRRPGEGGFVRADWRFIHEYYTGMCAHLLARQGGAAGEADTNPALHEPQTIVCFEDHLSYVHRSPVHVGQGLIGGVQRLSAAHRDFARRFGLRDHGYLQPLPAGDEGNQGSEGISHSLMAEQYALPGQLVVGTDSHTPHSGALGCVAFGVGTTDIANAFVTGAVRFTMPEVLRAEVAGRLPTGVSAKDLVLHLLAQPAIRAGLGVGKVFEFGGPAVRALGTDERATLTNMTAEFGGFTGLVEPDEETRRFLRERRGIDFPLEPWMRSDPGAAYAATIHVDASALPVMVARPGDPGRGVALSELGPLEERPRVDIAYGGSCTAGKREDFVQYHAVLAWAAARGLRAAPGVRLYLQFGTVAVREHCAAAGMLDAFEAVGAELLQPACGACANCGPGASTDAAQVTVSAINRNFPGRSGPGQVWLASPATVAASAIAGRLCSFDELQRSIPERAAAAPVCAENTELVSATPATPSA